MHCMCERLVQTVQQFQESTGEETMTVVIEKRDESMDVHRIGFDPRIGLIVDGKPRSLTWYVDAEGRTPMCGQASVQVSSLPQLSPA